KTDYIDKITGKTIGKITTGQIYWGAVPFVCIQLVMVALVIAFPQLVLSGLDRGPAIDLDKVRIEIPEISSGVQPFDPGSIGGGDAPPEPDPDPALDAMRPFQKGN
ncbi:hypothetical protein J2850_005497, partial [Azospirillum picis]